MRNLKSVQNDLTEFLRRNAKRILGFIIFTFCLSLIPYPNPYFREVSKATALTLADKINLPTPPPYPVNSTGNKPPDVTAAGIYILDEPSNITIYQRNADERFLPASTTKIASGLVALDHYNLEDVLTVKTLVSDGRAMGLRSGEKITAEALLYGMLVHSGNDAAYTLAENYPGGVESFVAAMNSKTKEYYLENTHFTNPIGFDDPGNYTTAFDLGKLAKIALENKTFAKIVSTKSITVSDASYSYFHPLTNVNELLGRVPGVSGVKTGFTENAGEIVVTQVKKDGRFLILVVLKSRDRFGETQKLIDWVFGNFTWKNIDEITPVPAPTNVGTVQGFTPATQVK